MRKLLKVQKTEVNNKKDEWNSAVNTLKNKNAKLAEQLQARLLRLIISLTPSVQAVKISYRYKNRL